MFEVYSRNFWFVELLYNIIDFILGIPCLDAYKCAAKRGKIIQQYLVMKSNGNQKAIQDKSNRYKFKPIIHVQIRLILLIVFNRYSILLIYEIMFLWLLSNGVFA